MKKYLYLLVGAVLVACQSSETTYKNSQIKALIAANETFAQLSARVDSISCNLSPEEQGRAAFFLVSAYSLAIEANVEKGNPAMPMLTEWENPPRKFGGDNPYTIYTQAPLDTKFSYKLSGDRGSFIYLGVQLYGTANGYNIPTNNIGLKDIIFEKDGTFEINISTVRPQGAKNWVQMSEADHALLVRQYFDQRQGIIVSNLKIERTDDNPDGGFDYLKRLDILNNMLTEMIMGTIEVNNLLRENAFNKYPDKNAQVRAPKYGGALYPTKDNRYEGCWISLDKGQAMRIHGKLPQNTLYASYVFYDRWYNTPDYRNGINCFRTMNEVVLNPDGTFDLYISPEKIDHPNWLNTGGLYEGSYSSRYMQSQETEFPTVEIVNITDIKPFQGKTTNN